MSGRDRGSAATEMSFAVIAMLAVIALIVGGMRVVTRSGSVDAAAAAGARAAAGGRDKDEADQLADRAARSALVDSDCGSVTVDTDGWAPGAVVTVTVTCQVDMSDVSAAEFDDQTLTGRGAERVESIRGK